METNVAVATGGELVEEPETRDYTDVEEDEEEEEKEMEEGRKNKKRRERLVLERCWM